MQFKRNFTGLIDTSSSCAYLMGFPVEWSLAELWPLIKKGVLNKTMCSTHIQPCPCSRSRTDLKVKCQTISCPHYYCDTIYPLPLLDFLWTWPKMFTSTRWWAELVLLLCLAEGQGHPLKAICQTILCPLYKFFTLERFYSNLALKLM
jgi:hypothetical protein